MLKHVTCTDGQSLSPEHHVRVTVAACFHRIGIRDVALLGYGITPVHTNNMKFEVNAW